MDRLHAHLREQLALQGVALDAICFFPHHPSGSVKELAIECDCRKPATGLLLQAAKDFDLDMSASALIGDRLSDVQDGKRTGVGRVGILESGHKVEDAARLQADDVAADLLAAAQLLTAS